MHEEKRRLGQQPPGVPEPTQPGEAATAQAILDTLPDPVLLVDETGTIRFANRRAGQVFLHPPSSLAGTPVERLIPRFANGGWTTFRCASDAAHDGPWQELTVLRCDGSVIVAEAACGGRLAGSDDGPFVLGLHPRDSRDDIGRPESGLLTRAFEQSPLAMLIVDPLGRPVHGNPAFCRLSGETLSDSRDREQPLLACRLETFADRLRDMQRNDAQAHIRVFHQTTDGQTLALIEDLSPIADESGRITHFLVTRQDITDQETTKAALQRSEQRFRKVTELAGEWLWEQNGEGHYTYSSAALFDILGYRPEEILGRSYLDILTEGDRQHWTTALPASPNIPRPFHRLINRYRHKDGHEVFTESSGEPVLGERGEILAWRGVDHDITARKRFEDALRLRDRAIEAASVGITIIDARAEQRTVIYVNAALSQMLGVPKEDLLRRSHNQLQGPSPDTVTWRLLDEAMDEGSGCSLTARLHRQDGAEFWCDIQISPVRDTDGQVSHFVWVIADVTERQRAVAARHELEMARKIQASLLPKEELRTDRLEATGLCVPAGAIGGDFFDYFTTRDGVSLALADVSGHSVGAALMMSETRSALRAEIRTARSEGSQFGPADMLSLLNELLFEDLNGADLFITMFFIDFDPVTRRLRYANAGHCPGMLTKRGRSECLSLDADGLILGVRPNVRFEEKILLLQPGDMVLLYTDGVIEASNASGEFYGAERLAAELIRHRDLPIGELARTLLGGVRAHCGPASHLDDDTSLLLLRVL